MMPHVVGRGPPHRREVVGVFVPGATAPIPEVFWVGKARHGACVEKVLGALFSQAEGPEQALICALADGSCPNRSMPGKMAAAGQIYLFTISSIRTRWVSPK